MGGAKRTANIGGGASDLKREEKLQAVVLADVCARKLRPATFDGPKALMPLANVPLLEYTLEFLCAGGVEEVFVFACHGAEAIDAYLRTVEPRFHPATLRCIASRAPCFSAGDALREVFEANVIQGEFVLAPGDVVTNLSLPALVAAHRAARESDKDTLLTACFARVPYGHRIRACDDSAVLVIDSLTGRLLHYEPMPQGLAPRHAAAPPAADADAPLSPAPRVQLPLELLEAAAKSGSELRVRADLLDLRIDVCTLEVLTLLVDNFDWGELRTDMLTSVLSSDILCKTVHVHEMGPASLGSAASAPYAARATDWRTYAELTADVLARWTFPMVPDSNLLGSMDAVAGQPGAPLPASAELGSSYRQGRGNLYTERDVSLARSSQLGVRVLLGGGSSVGADACVSRSVLGRRCVIGDRAVVVDSVLWAGVRVGEGARVHGAVLCEGVQVGPGAHVGPGCILGRGVVVGAGVRLAPRTLFTRHAARALKPGKGGAEEADEEAGSDGGGEWAEGDEDSDDAFSDDEEEDKEGGLGAAHAGTPPDGAAEAAHALGPGGIGFVHAASAPSASFACARPQPRLPLETDTSDDGGEGEEGAAAQAGGSGDVFVETALDILAGMLEDGNEVDNIVLEVNALKFAYNRSVADCAAVSLHAILARAHAVALRSGHDGEGKPVRKELLDKLRAGLKRWAPLLRRYVTSTSEQLRLIDALEELGEEALPWSDAVFHVILHALYLCDVLPEPAIVKWAEGAQAAPAGSKRKVRHGQCAAFLKWLEEAEEDESGSEEEESDEDDGED